MKCTANITVQANEHADKLMRLFAVEDKKLSNKRGSYTLTQEGTSVIFFVEANDAIALRAMSGAITKTLSVFERAKQTIEELK